MLETAIRRCAVERAIWLAAALAFFVTMFISGCATVDRSDRSALTKFNRIAEYNTYDLWRYEATAMTVSSSYGLTEEGEATRMRWLIEHMQLNDLSIFDYEIVDKKTVLLVQGLLGASYKMTYTVKIAKGSSTVK